MSAPDSTVSLAAPVPVPLYQSLGAHYLAAIRAGALKPGDRFPSVRQLMRSHSVSLTTALRLCRELEDQGWLQAKPRSGYFVQQARRASLLPASDWPVVAAEGAGAVDSAPYVGIHARVSEILARGQQVPVRVNLALAVGVPELYPTSALQRGMQRILRQHPELLTTMTRRHGHPLLRQVVARRMLERGVNVAPHELIITHGCTEAVNLALRAVTQPGDTVAVESPTFYGLLQVLETLGLRALEIPTSPHTGLSLEALAFALEQGEADPSRRIRAIVAMPTLHNPLGCTMPDAHKERLVRLCEAHDVALIEDDIYNGMGAPGERLQPAKAWDRSGHVIYCDSLNKIVAPGLRLGWMLAGRWQERVEMIKYTQSRYTPELPQVVVADFLGSPGMNRHLHHVQSTLQRQREQMAEAIATHFPPGTRLSVPSGGMLLWIELPAGVSGDALFEAALAQGIKIAPGSMFSNGPRYNQFIRLSCAAPHSAEIAAAVRELGALVRELQAQAQRAMR